MQTKQNLNNCSIQALVGMSISCQRTLEQREKAIEKQRAKLDEMNTLIKKKQKEAGLNDKDMEEMRKKAEERFEPPDICPI